MSATLGELRVLIESLKKRKIEVILIGGQSISIAEDVEMATKDSDFLLTSLNMTRLHDAFEGMKKENYKFDYRWVHEEWEDIIICKVDHKGRKYRADFLDAYLFTPDRAKEQFYTIVDKEMSVEKHGIRVALPEAVIYTRLVPDPTWKKYVEKTVENAVEVYDFKQKTFDLNKVEELARRLGSDNINDRLEYLRKRLIDRGLPY